MCTRGEGGILIFLHIRKLRPFFGVQKFEISVFLFFFSEKRIFLGYEDFVDIFLGSSQNWTIFRGLFLRSRYRMWDIFWGC